jgi:hypothetical protein
MITAGRNQELICYQLRNNLYLQLDNPLKKDIDQLSKKIKEILATGKKIGKLSTALLGDIFNLRIKAAKWLANNNKLDYSKILNEMPSEIEKFKKNEKLEILVENILFAMRCNKRVADSVLNSSENATEVDLNLDIKEMPELTYPMFLASLATIPSDEVVQKMVDWTNSSLQIEFVMLATDIIHDHKLDIADNQIDELSFLVADAAQEYAALATEFGVLKRRSVTQKHLEFDLDPAFVQEQKDLADRGLDDFAKVFGN